MRIKSKDLKLNILIMAMVFFIAIVVSNMDISIFEQMGMSFLVEKLLIFFCILVLGFYFITKEENALGIVVVVFISVVLSQILQYVYLKSIYPKKYKVYDVLVVPLYKDKLNDYRFDFVDSSYKVFHSIYIPKSSNFDFNKEKLTKVKEIDMDFEFIPFFEIRKQVTLK